MRSNSRAGLSLVELLVVLGIVSLMLAISFPAVTSGVEAIELRAAADRAGAFWAAARQQADRRQSVVQVTVDPKANEVRAVAADGGWSDAYSLDRGLTVAVPPQKRAYWIYPGSPSQRFELMLAGRSGDRAGVRVNVFTGVPEPWKPEETKP